MKSVMLMIKQFLCGLFLHHRFKDTERITEYNEQNHTFTITERCCKCGKEYSFTAEERLFGGLTNE